ncbi:MAG: MmcQ/YjbR family DNA-binding protein [Reyranellales bacterium]
MAPRKLSLSAIRRTAHAFPGVEEGPSYGTPAWRFKGKLIARLNQDGQSMMFKLGFEAREHLMRADPRTFFITEHYRNYPSVLARLDRLTSADLRGLLHRSIENAVAKAKRR